MDPRNEPFCSKHVGSVAFAEGIDHQLLFASHPQKIKKSEDDNTGRDNQEKDDQNGCVWALKTESGELAKHADDLLLVSEYTVE